MTIENNWNELKEWLQDVIQRVEITIEELKNEKFLKDVLDEKKIKLKYLKYVLSKMQEIESGKNEIN